MDAAIPVVACETFPNGCSLVLRLWQQWRMSASHRPPPIRWWWLSFSWHRGGVHSIYHLSICKSRYSGETPHHTSCPDLGGYCHGLGFLGSWILLIAGPRTCPPHVYIYAAWHLLAAVVHALLDSKWRFSGWEQIETLRLVWQQLLHTVSSFSWDNWGISFDSYGGENTAWTQALMGLNMVISKSGWKIKVYVWPGLTGTVTLQKYRPFSPLPNQKSFCVHLVYMVGVLKTDHRMSLHPSPAPTAPSHQCRYLQISSSDQANLHLAESKDLWCEQNHGRRQEQLVLAAVVSASRFR